MGTLNLGYQDFDPRKDAEVFMYPGPIRNQAFDILLKREDTGRM